MSVPDVTKKAFSEQDTADKLILPYLTQQNGFPTSDSLDYQAQHTLPIDEEHAGRYDGLYLQGGYPHAVLEAKKYVHDLTDKDFRQARDYALSNLFDDPVPFIIVSNGREHKFYRKTTELDLEDNRIAYRPIPETHWADIVREKPGQLRILLTAEQLLRKVKDIKEWVYRDLKALFFDLSANKYNLDMSPLFKNTLQKIIDERKVYVGTTSDPQKQIEFAIQTVALHFTIKILFIKIIEDLSSGPDTPRIIHSLFPRQEYDLVGGVFGHKVLNSLRKTEIARLLRLYLKSKEFYSQLGQDITKVSYQDIFRFGFNVHMVQYGKILKAANYDRFFPAEETLKQIREELIKIDVRSAIIYASPEAKNHVIGDIYAGLIDKELRDSIGAVYTPDDTVDFMVELGRRFLGRFRGKKIIENACGSGHFYRQIYRTYVNEVADDYRRAGSEVDYRQAHSEALERILGRDIDPFAIQLTILAVFLEQLKDNVKASTLKEQSKPKLWKANLYIDCQNSLDPITVSPDSYWDYIKTLDLESPKSLLNSCRKALYPDLIIGNPPYGVKVVEGTHYDDIYDLQSKDSYGYFIANAIKRLPEGKRVIFITSSSYLTIKSHFKLRKLILDSCKIIRILKLHRSTFPGIDIFPAIIELEKCPSQEERDSNFYQFYDLWQLHPVGNRGELKEVYDFVLENPAASSTWPFDAKRINRYNNRQGIVHIYSQKTIFDGLPSLYGYMEDFEKKADPIHKLFNREIGRDVEFKIKRISGLNLIKLGKVAYAVQGLIPPSARNYYRITPGGKGGAVKGGYIDVDPSLTLSLEETTVLSKDEKEHGIDINDPDHEKHFVPLDKTGASDIEGKILSNYYRPVEFYVNWSRNAVHEMKTSSRGRFQGSRLFFKEGISYSDTGIYSPTFRLSHGGVFDQKASFIFSEYFSREFLLGLLCSKLVKYFVKVFINHSVSAQVDSIKEIPIAIPTDEQRKAIEDKVKKIIANQRLKPSYDYYAEQLELDPMVNQLYKLNAQQVQEVDDWYARRYPKLRRDIDIEEVEED